LDWALCASPISGANAVRNEQDKQWKVSQGELFTGTLNVRDILAQNKGNVPVVNFLVGADNVSKDEKVLIKVCSRTVHFFLIDPVSAYGALKELWSDTRIMAFQFTQDFAAEAIQVPNPHLALQREISSVLFAAFDMGVGIVTVMADLSKRGYGMLSPQGFTGKIATLWEGFRNLVTKVLLPLAKIGFIHADIRPGFDETTNVLCKVEGVGTASESAVLKLIDYESIIRINHWYAPSNGSYIARQSMSWTATTFVWWQCLAVAHAWETKTLAANLFNDEMGLVPRLQAALVSWLPDFQHCAFEDAIPEEVVMQTLERLSKDFTDESDEKQHSQGNQR
jgi:hypothetical protein